MPLNFEKLHILVVEDIYAMQEIIAQMLMAMGVGKVSKAQNGKDGYDMYNYLKPDLIITDWHMPKMNGYEMIEKIRKSKDSHDRSIPIILLTGYCSEKRINIARNAGVTEFLAKPFSAEELSKRITYIIANPRDFIAIPNFIGPDRRRKQNKNFSGSSNRVKETDRKIKADRKLQKKTGYNPALVNEIDKSYIEKSQKVMEENSADFVSMAKTFLFQLNTVTNQIRLGNLKGIRACDELVFPVMQIKANAKILKYNLAGDLAEIMLDFLEGLRDIDDQVLEIINAQHKTLTYLVNHQKTGDNGEDGENLKKELKSVCRRHMKTVYQQPQGSLVS